MSKVALIALDLDLIIRYLIIPVVLSYLRSTRITACVLLVGISGMYKTHNEQLYYILLPLESTHLRHFSFDLEL